MKNTYLCLFLALVAVITTAQVPLLTKSNFNQFLSANKVTFVKFFAPWCGHCIRMVPEVQKLYAQEQKNGFKIVKVDCTVQQQLCGQQKVQGFPTLKLYISGVGINYNGGRTAVDIVSWVKSIQSQILPPISSQQIKKKSATQSFIVVGGLQRNDEILISGLLKTRYTGLSAYKTTFSTKRVLLYVVGRTQPVQYHWPLDPFVFPYQSFHRTRKPIMDLNSPQLLNYFETQDQINQIIVLVQNNQKINPLLEQAQKICSQKIVDILCVSLQKNLPNHEQLAQKLKIKDNNVLAVVVNKDFSVGYHYLSDQGLTLSQFLQQTKSEKRYKNIDKQRDTQLLFQSQFVLKLTDQTFNSTINSHSIIFVQFYATYCGHCVRLAPQYAKVGEHFSKEGGATVASIDANKYNSIGAQAGVQGFPTLKLYLNGHAVDYDGERNAESIITFISSFIGAKLRPLSQRAESTPYIQLKGISQDSPLNYLAAVFKQHPIYYTNEGQFSLKFIGQKTLVYEGGEQFNSALSWIEDKTGPILVSLGETVPSRKLSLAVKKKLPIFTIINRLGQGTVTKATQTLTTFCETVDNVVCTYLNWNQPDYQSIQDWIKDSDKSKNRFVWVNIGESKVYIYPGEPNQATHQDLTKFVRSIFTGQLKPHNREQQQEETEEESSKEEGQSTGQDIGQL